jgi:hopanoid biosynthesis associated RND transporter like protein HpnN
MSLQRLLVAAVEFSRRHSIFVVLLGAVLAGLSLFCADRYLGVTTETALLFNQNLQWRQRQIAFDREFPQFSNVLVAVIDARIPEEADATAAALADKLAADHAHFERVSRPGASPFFRREGLLFLDTKTLQSLLDRTVDAQPFLGQLAADPSARGLFAALGLLGQGVQHGQADLTPYLPALRGFHKTLAAALAGHPQPLSWEDLLAGPVAAQAGQYRFVLAQPRLNYGAIEAGQAATDALRTAAEQLPFVKSGQARVRITGNVALSDQEFATVRQGMVSGTIISIALITLWLFLAVGSWRLVVPIVLTLLVGGALTTGFAAMAVGTLNLISLAFAILFVGIAVDFAIQFCVRYREVRMVYREGQEALAETTRRVGNQILVAALATAAGFYAFVPTDFRGVAELGLIAGTGMIIAFICTLCWLPAALTLFHPCGETAEVGFRVGKIGDMRLHRFRIPVLLAFGAVAIAGAALLPRLQFDSDPLHTKNPHTEAMRTLADLMNNPLTNPYTVDIVAPSVQAAEGVATRLRGLPLVANVLTANSFVPDDQAPKLADINDAATILGPTLAAQPQPPPVTPAALRQSIAAASKQIDPALAKLPADHPLAAIASDLHQLQAAPDPMLTTTNAALTRFLPEELGRLRDALAAEPVTLASLPADMKADWVLPDGRARVQVIPKPTARGSAGLHAFVSQVRSVAPDAGGAAATIVDTSATIIHAFRTAAIAALVAIALILLLILRQLLDVALVLAPLLLSALMTVVVAVALPLPLNFANIIALPLLLGIGVSFNIYFVMNWRARRHWFLGSATARAVLFSAFATGTAFGSLALSAHPGTASMGHLLLLSLGCTLVASLVFEPTLLSGIRPYRRAQLALPAQKAPAPQGERVRVTERR